MRCGCSSQTEPSMRWWIRYIESVPENDHLENEPRTRREVRSSWAVFASNWVKLLSNISTRIFEFSTWKRLIGQVFCWDQPFTLGFTVKNCVLWNSVGRHWFYWFFFVHFLSFLTLSWQRRKISMKQSERKEKRNAIMSSNFSTLLSRSILGIKRFYFSKVLRGLQIPAQFREL